MTRNKNIVGSFDLLLQADANTEHIQTPTICLDIKARNSSGVSAPALPHFPVKIWWTWIHSRCRKFVARFATHTKIPWPQTLGTSCKLFTWSTDWRWPTFFKLTCSCPRMCIKYNVWVYGYVINCMIFLERMRSYVYGFQKSVQVGFCIYNI